MWTMPFTGWVFDAVFISVNVPSYQKPSRSDLRIRELFVLCAAPKGLAGASPEHVQEPAKYLTCDISGAGLGGCWARAEEATSRRTAADAAVVFIVSLLGRRSDGRTNHDTQEGQPPREPRKA